MACYAAVLSVMQTMHHIKVHPRPPISLDQNQVDSLTENLTFFQHFLESYPNEDDDLESRIAAAAYAAEDVIETHIVDQIHHAGSNISTVDFPQARRRVMDLIKKKVKKMMGAQKVDEADSDLYGGLKRVIQEMDLIRGEVVEIIQHKITRAQDYPHMHTNSSVSMASTRQSSTMPVFDDALIEEVLDKLTGQQSSLQIIPLVGMGGIGKTTFARNIYVNPLIVQHFDTLAWVTVSQEYSRRNILQVLCQEFKGSVDGLSEDEIGEILYKHLWGRRYLLVMDDIWSVDAWYKVKSFFPNNNNGSRIVITTRLTNLAFELSGSHDFRMQFLDEDKSWDLLCRIVFGKLDCPVELEDIGKEIARNCRGLPLSIAVIGGLLTKSNMTRVYWEYSLRHLNSLINLEDNEYCLQVLRTSYKELPIHLKPCFLYMGVFPEDYEINVSKLIKLWVSEGILKPNDDKSLEEVAEEYLKELIERNLVLVHELRWDGKTKLCKIHDLLRDVCSREAKRQKLICVLRQHQHHTPHEYINMERRICIHQENENQEYSPEFFHALESTSLARSLLYYIRADGEKVAPSLGSRLLRVYSPLHKYNSIIPYTNNAIFEQANLRHLSLKLNFRNFARRLLCLCSLLWNLQTLTVVSADQSFFKPKIATFEIWEMPLLRHATVKKFALPDPPDGENNFVLDNLQTLSSITNFKFSDEVVKRIPNIRKLEVEYTVRGHDDVKELSNSCLNNLGRLQKLESLNLAISSGYECDLKTVRRNLVSFPHSLKKLTLIGTKLNWEELTIRIGSLPLLQLLRLVMNACVGPRWETVEGQFYSLRVLKIEYCMDLKYWDTDSAHFPRLEHLFLQHLHELEEIPSSIGDVPTLKSIRLDRCLKSAVDSARRIKEEQEENGNEDLQVVATKTRNPIGVASDSANLEAD